MNKSGSGKGIYLVGIIVVVAAGAGVGYTYLSRQAHDKKEVQAKATEADGANRVKTVIVKESPADRRIEVVGEADPFLATTIYSKISGYLAKINVDKGDHVKKDDLLATITAQEQVLDYDAAVADAKNKRGIAKRMVALRNRQLASDQEADQAVADADVAEAKVGSLGVIKGYEVLRAPFEGQITGRFADPGALVQNSAQPVVTIATVDHLRIGVYVDQQWAPFIKIGDQTEVWTLERPDAKEKGTVSRISGELDPRTKMLLAEIDFDNKAGTFVPGSFVQVALNLKVPSHLEVPVGALFTRKDKHLVVVVDDKGTISYREVRAGDNDGTTVQILSGLKSGERVAVDTADNIAEGQKVQVIAE